MVKLIFLAFLLYLNGASSHPFLRYSRSEVSKPAETPNIRLPNNTKPIHYDVFLLSNIHLDESDPEKFEFYGNESIEIRVLETSKFVTLHAKQLRILGSSIVNSFGEVLEYSHLPEYDPAREFLTFRVKDYLFKDEIITLNIDYSGTLRNDNFGFYRSSYVDGNGTRRWQATTQFQLTEARHALPCYDEPQMRATFRFTISAAKDLTVLFNTPLVKKIVRANDMADSLFEDTPPMQPYLLGFVISDFPSIVQPGDIVHRVFGRPEAIRNGEGKFGLQVGADILKFQQDFFGMNYSLPKMDHIAIPSYSAGAAENWGLITYREPLLLYDPLKPSVAQRRSIAQIIAHETAHQFFGNLVSPNFWYYFWLSEGFATLLEYKMSDALFPDFRNMDSFITGALHLAMQKDAGKDTRAMTTFSDNVDLAFFFSPSGFVVYQKAGSVLRMLMLALGEDTFRKGVSYYLETNQFTPVDSDDLARGLEKAAREDQAVPRSVYLKDVVDSWALQVGHPVVTVQMDDFGRLIIKQSRFSYSGETSNQTWFLPITIASETQPDFSTTTPLLWWNEASFTLAPYRGVNWTKSDWIVLNVQQVGFFRVNYEEIFWNRIVQKLKSDSFEDIHYINRAQLIDDSLNLARGRLLSYYTGLQVAEYLAKETDFVPWTTFNTNLNLIDRLLSDSRTYRDFQRFIKDLIAKLYSDYGIEDGGDSEPLPEKTKRSIGIKWACLTGDESCLKTTSDKVIEAILSPEKEPHPELRFLIYCNGLRKSNESVFESVWNKLLSSEDQTYRVTLAQSLACSQDDSLLDRLLYSTLQPEQFEYFELERVEILYAVFMGGRNGLQKALTFLSENLAEVERTYVAIPNPVKAATFAMTDFITSPGLLEQYTSLLEQMQEEGLLTQEEKTFFLQATEENLLWLERNEAEIERFLGDYFGEREFFKIVL